MQFTRDRLRREDPGKKKDMANVNVNKETTAKSHNFQNYSKDFRHLKYKLNHLGSPVITGELLSHTSLDISDSQLS